MVGRGFSATLCLLVGIAGLSGLSLAASARAAPSAQAYVEQAVTLHNKGDCARAVVLLQRAIVIQPAYVRAHTWLGVCYAKLGQRARAAAAFKKVLVLAPSSDDARLARQWLPRVQATVRPTPRPAAVSTPPPSPFIYLVSLAAAAGISDGSRPPRVQLFGVTYRRALVERRNWWQRRRAEEREWRVVYNLQRRFSRFHVVAGVEDETPAEFTATFEVRGDGNRLYESPPKRSGDVPATIDLDVVGVLQLELIVRGADPLHTRDLSVVWADPYVDPRPAVAPPGGGPGTPGPSTVPAVPPGSAPPATPAPVPTSTPGAWRTSTSYTL